MAGADRDLLLASLVLHVGFVSEDVLREALRESGQASRSLGTVLRNRHALSELDLTLLDGLVDLHLRLHGNDLAQSLASLPSSVDLSQLVPPTRTDLAATLGTLGAAENATPPVPGPPVSMESRQRRFRVLRSHARGGLGEVFLAQDEELQREVALKEIQQRHAHNPESRARFVLEAELTGRLEHPGIVPVYGLGCYDDGRPYYAMRFIKGDSLDDAIRRFHEQDAIDSQSGNRVLELRKLLGRFLAVCDAIAYAHSRGVLHRDLKPANIMLGPYGETLVVDWGLGKTLGQAEVAASSGSAEQRVASDTALTQMGAIMGTPAFMSPEQASGEVNALSPASDVYSLGATLYVLLTGNQPFEGTDLGQTLDRVRRGDFPPPRSIKANVPVPLEAICRKAMARRPEDRYLSARSLADDLEHWLADEPVLAYPESLRMRLARWRRRHQTLVSTLTALCATALLALAISSALLVAEQGRTRRAESDRVRAQVQALLNANPQAVPALLESLEPFRDQTTPILHELLDDTTLGRRRRNRVRLALLQHDPSQLPHLRRQLTNPALAPEEMLLLCQVLQPHQSKLTADLWAEAKQQGVDTRRQFRCLVALAQFDSENSEWPAVADLVVEGLLGGDLLHVGVWTTALRPVRMALMESLGRVFRDPVRHAERRAAAGILQDYASDKSEVLADLLVDADEHQFALIFPTLEDHKDTVIDLLNHELNRKATPGWPRIDIPRRALKPAFQQEVEAAAGFIAEDFALCQTLPLARFAVVAEAMGEAGYRPIRIRPFLAGKEHRAAVVWLRDGKQWRYSEKASADEIRKQADDYRRQGFRPVDVAGYLDSTERYLALWELTPDNTDNIRLLVGEPIEKQKEASAGFVTAGLIPRTWQVFTAAGGKQFCNIVWGLDASAYNFLATSPLTQSEYDEKLKADRLLVDVTLLPAQDAPRYCPLLQHGGALTAIEFHGLTPAQHLDRCRELTKQGYRPAALSVVDMKGLIVASVWHRPVVPETELETLARRQANAAAALLRLGQDNNVWNLLQHHDSDPRRRTYLLHRFGPLGVDAELLVKRLETKPEVSARRALILSLGMYTPEQLPAALRDRIVPRLLEWYRDDPDPGIHGAIGWLLGQSREGPEPRRLDWKQADALHRLDASPSVREPGNRLWYVNGIGQAMTIIPKPAPFRMGSPYYAPQRRSVEDLHYRRIDRRFALATTPVTVEQFQKFLEAHPRILHTHQREYSPAPDGPALNMNWYEGAQFCRWLSEVEKIAPDQMCYPTVAELEECKDGKKPVPLPANVLSRTGYRLPTEAEWEYACRAGSETSRYYGHSEEMLGAYAWFALNSRDRTWPVGQKMPNDFGLFDMQGNVWQWCHNEYHDAYPPGRKNAPAKDDDGLNEVPGEGSRALRGGTFFLHSSSLRSAFRQYDRPTYRFLTFGFRVARTQP
jgi:serine/threonine protein kinase/formylglycine-generating enzyme required for sulfatase activity